jgi:hypothetical protein
MKFESLNWDDAWAEIVRPFHEANDEFHSNMGDMPDREFSNLETKVDRAEAKYDKFCLASAECKLYAERLIANLADKNPTYQFAAHTDPFGHPPNSWWRVLVRSASGKAITSQAFQKLEPSAKAILRNVEKKYPGEGKKAQEAAEKAHEAKLKKQGVSIKKVDGGVRVSVKGSGSGCMLLVVLITSALGLALAVML